MNELELLRQFGARLAAEADPQIDVGARVLQQIARTRPRGIDVRSSLISAAVCVISAMAFLAISPARVESDTFAALYVAATSSTGPQAVSHVLESGL